MIGRDTEVENRQLKEDNLTLKKENAEFSRLLGEIKRLNNLLEELNRFADLENNSYKDSDKTLEIVDNIRKSLLNLKNTTTTRYLESINNFLFSYLEHLTYTINLLVGTGRLLKIPRTDFTRQK